MTREEKIEAIYKEMANKKVAFGCRYEHNGSVYTVDSGNYRLRKHGDLYCLYIDAHCNCPIDIAKQYNDFSNQGVVKIIGHPVMIGDVLNWIDNKKFNVDDPMIGLFYDPKKMDYETKLFLVQDYLFGRVNGYWRKKRKPIEEQSDECIDFVHSLIKKS